MVLNSQEDILALIARNLAGNADTDDIFQLNVWIESSPENRKYYRNSGISGITLINRSVLMILMPQKLIKRSLNVFPALQGKRISGSTGKR